MPLQHTISLGKVKGVTGGFEKIPRFILKSQALKGQLNCTEVLWAQPNTSS